MVMETPSPQCVGREFVRQYYTLLHEAPLHLHRFYSHNSSFVHGGVEKPGEEQPPVMGQQDIHKKIISLNFCDCHAKIRQVDSQATIGNGVVVQVTGELSNNGQQMRRFMQTFVLAPQSPKKFYVHNDIFRYQDEVFHDAESDTENQEDVQDSEGDDSEQCGIQQDLLPDTQQFYDAHSTPLSNGTGLPEVHTPPSSPNPESEEPIEMEGEIINPAESYEPAKEPQEEPLQVEEQVEDEPRKPFSWADVTSKNTSSRMVPVAQAQAPAPVIKPSPGFGPRQENKDDISPPGPKEQRIPRGPRIDRPDRDRTTVNRDDGEAVDHRGARYPDTNQLFVGNLPHNVTEKELKTFFEDMLENGIRLLRSLNGHPEEEENYGTVLETRINLKQGSGSGKVPNFGFVVFSGPEPVQTILANKLSKPIKFREQRLNVEEKKPRGSEGRPIGRGPPPRSGSASGGGFINRGGSAGRGGGPRGGGGLLGMRDAARGGFGSGINRGGGTSGPRR